MLYHRSFGNSVTNVKEIPGKECDPQHHLLVVDFTIRSPHPKMQKFTQQLWSWKLRVPVTASEFHFNTTFDVKRTLFKAYKKLRKQGNSSEAKKAKETYLEAKRSAKREVCSA